VCSSDLSYGTAYGRRGSRSNMSSLGAVHIDNKTGAVTPLTRGNPLSRGIPLGILGSHSGSSFNKNRSLLSKAMSFASGKNIKNPAFLGRVASAAGNFAPGRRIPGAIRFNRGGMVPSQNGNKYNMGGMVEGYNRGGIISEAREKGFFGQGLTKPRVPGGMSPMGGIGVGMGMQFAGQAIGGTAGTIMQMASVLPMIAPGGLTKILTIVPKIVSGFTSMTKIITVVRSGLVLLTRAIPGAAVLAGIYALVKGFQAWRKSIEDAKKESIALNGISEKSAKELGINYVSLTDRVKALREEQQLAKDKATAYFESYTSAGVGGLTLTIEKLRELKERVKTDMPETIGVLNSIDSSKVNDWANNLKAQMVSSGKSVEDATNLIYALIEASNKAGQGVGAISNKMFSSITDQGQAADYILKNLAKNIKNISDIDPSAFASNLDTALTSLDSAVESLIGTKDANGNLINETKALSIQYERIVKSGVKNNEIGKDTLKVIQQQRPEFANILNSSDTIGGLIAKWRVHTKNVFLDLKNITSQQAELLAGYYDAMDAATNAALLKDGGVEGLGSAANVLDKLTKSEKAARTASTNGAAAAEKYNKAKVAALQNELKEIKKLADAKRKALDDSFDKENAELELQKAKIELQSAVARGDNEAIATAQIRIRQIQSESSLKAARSKIDSDEQKEEDRINKAIESENKKRDDKVVSAGKSGVSADNISKTKALVTEIAKEIADVAAKRKISESNPNDAKFRKDYEVAASNVLQKIATNAKDKDVMDAFGEYLQKDSKGNPLKDKKGNFIPIKAGTQIPYAPGTPSKADTMFSGLGANMETFAFKITGGVPFSKLYDLMAKNTQKDVTKDYGNINFNKFDPRTWANTDNMAKLIKGEGLVKDQTFTYKGSTYRVKETKGVPAFEKMAMGGYVRKYSSGSMGAVRGPGTSTSDSIPALLSNGEYVLNAAAVSKFGVPMLDQMNTAYNIPTGTKFNGMPSANNSYNNNVYNIDIDLNGTNVTPNDILRAFKAELALINAKEGRVRAFGGNY
jgi:hypothetical protein